jgi:hypothetical protein
MTEQTSDQMKEVIDAVAEMLKKLADIFEK